MSRSSGRGRGRAPNREHSRSWMWWPRAEALRAKEAQDSHARTCRTPQVTGRPRHAGTLPAGPSSSHVPITPWVPPLRGEAEATGGPGTCHQGLHAPTALPAAGSARRGRPAEPVAPDQMPGDQGPGARGRGESPDQFQLWSRFPSHISRAGSSASRVRRALNGGRGAYAGTA